VFRVLSIDPVSSDRGLVLGEGFLGELKLVLELVEGFLRAKTPVIVEFFCLLDQQL
jgi:hypothetical protein